MLNLFSHLLDANQKEVNRLAKLVQKITQLEPQVSKLSDKNFKNRSLELRQQLSQDNLEQSLPEVFALTREASKRINQARLYDVQLMAAIALHEGKIAEQKTGEGKTFSAAPAAVLNALAGKGVHIVTVNDYLARRECGWVGPVYFSLGVSCSTIIHEQSFIYDPEYVEAGVSDQRLKHLRPVSRKEAYAADITYGTNNEFGFDYLRDNMALSLDQQSQRGHFFAIVDEVDSILIDEARTPLIISAPAQEATDKYVQFAQVIQKLDASEFVIDEKLRTANLSEAGTLKIEKLLGIDNLYEKDFATLHHIEEALKARALFLKDRDYVVKDGEVIIVDEFTGRLMPGRRYSEGLHQAIEAKEGVAIQQESQTLATISFQNYFRMYQKLAGMTGTAATEAEEFHKIYDLGVVIIPTNQPMVRTDLPDSIYKSQSAKFDAVVEEVVRVHQTGQPVLVGTTSIDKNEYLSNLLKKGRISHALLNAKNHEKEAEIIAQAGQKGAVTVATNMAGRGVDIKLEAGVDRLGGLYVVGTERHESRRIDNQLRGRSGRQGDPGTSKFFVSLEDDLMRIFGGEQVSKVMDFLKMPENTPIENPLVSRAIEGAQKKVEGHNFDIRKHTVEYDDVMNQQRKIIYGIRQQILEAMPATTSSKSSQSESRIRAKVQEKIDKEIFNIATVNTMEGINTKAIIDEFATIIPFDSGSKQGLEKEISGMQSGDQISQFLSKLAHDLYESREKQLGAQVTRQMEAFVYLNTIDTLWIEHLDTIDDLRVGISLRGYAQRDPLIEYKKEAYELFERLVEAIDSEVVHRIYKVSVESQSQPVINLSAAQEKHTEALDETQLLGEIGQPIVQLEKPDQEFGQVELKEGTTKVTIERAGVVTQVGGSNSAHKKPGRNDPCWCGKKKTDGTPVKYKHCHYPN